MATTIVFTNQKGGVGKTTTSGALIVGLMERGKKVLGIDLDSQGNLGFSLGIDIDADITIYDVLKGEAELEEAIQDADGFDLIPSNILLSSIEADLPEEGRQLILKNILECVQDQYDYIIIDTPPALSIMTLNAYTAADYLIIPMASEILSLVGLIQLKETVNSVQDSVNPDLNVLGILLTKYNARTNLARDVNDMANSVATQIGTSVFDAKIRSSVAVAEAPAHGQSVLEYAPSSNPAQDYEQFVDEVLTRMKHKK